MYKHKYLKDTQLFTYAGAINFDKDGVARDIPIGAQAILESLADVEKVAEPVKKEPEKVEPKEPEKPVATKAEPKTTAPKKATKAKTAVKKTTKKGKK